MRSRFGAVTGPFRMATRRSGPGRMKARRWTKPAPAAEPGKDAEGSSI
jgi:hypothetical protein